MIRKPYLLTVVRSVLFALFVFLLVFEVTDHYRAVQTMVKFICINCMGLGG